jgi:hypothetical protein
MKITRLKKGYAIRLSDVEFDLLEQIHGEGFMAYAENHAEDMTGLSPKEKRILTEVVELKRDWMIVTEDRRITA